MVFYNGEHALKWLIRDATLLPYPRASTGTIIGTLKSGGNPKATGSSNNTEEDVEDKCIAYFDIVKLLERMEKKEVSILATYIIEGKMAALRELRKGEAWAEWREWRERRSNSKRKMPFTKKLWSILDKWDNILYEEDYIGDF